MAQFLLYTLRVARAVRCLTLLCCGVYSSAPVSKAGPVLDPDPGLLLQDLEPDHLARDLVAVAHTQIVIQMALAVEPNHTAVVITAPVLCIDTYQHSSYF